MRVRQMPIRTACETAWIAVLRGIRNAFGKSSSESQHCVSMLITMPLIITQAYVLFGAFWSSCFVSALADMVLAHTFAAWYWTNCKRRVPFLVTIVGLARTVRCEQLG